MKSVLISIQPQWCELIASGKKTLEVRKTRPKLEMPFKVYIYCTKGSLSYPVPSRMICHMNGGMAVIGEFVCDRIDFHTPDCLVVKEDREKAIDGSCLNAKEARDYLRGKRISYNLLTLPGFYCWHISKLKIYDRPKRLNEFRKACGTQNCDICQFWENTGEYAGCLTSDERRLRRPPQSWCYVEDFDDEGN